MKRIFPLLLLLAFTASAFAQDPQTGYPPYGSFEADRFDGINRQNLNVNFSIPIVSNPGRGKDFNFAIVYDSLIWKKNGNAWSPVTDYGWKKETPAGKTTFVKTTVTCQSGGTANRYNSYAYTDVAGTRHNFAVDFYDVATNCNYPTGPRTGSATDGSGISIDATSPESAKITIPDGTVFAGGQLTDTNGNYFTQIIVSSTETDWTDTLGRIVLKIKKPSSTTIEYHVQDTTGAYRVTTMTLQNFDIKTGFACSGVVEFNGTA